MVDNTLNFRISANKLLFILIAAAIFTFVGQPLTWAKVEFETQELTMKNSEQMTDLINKRLARAQRLQANQPISDLAQANPEAVAQLYSALLIVLARPDTDGIRGSLYTKVRRELKEINSFETSLQKISTEAIDALKNKATSVALQNTYIHILNNLLSEIAPEINSNPKLKTIVQSALDAKLEISKELQAQQLMKSMSRPVSPSETAQKILQKN